MLAVARPEGEIVEGGRRGYEGVAQFHMMALGKLSYILSRLNSNLGVDGDAMDRGKKCVERSVLLRTGAVPKLRDGHRRTHERGFNKTQLAPSKEDTVIPGTGDFDEDIRVDQDGLQEASPLSRFPLRRRRT